MRIVLSNASVKWGGVHVVTELLARGLSARGHSVTIFGAPGSILEERMNGIVPFEPILQGMDLHPMVLLNARKALKRHAADVVLAMMKKDVRLTVPAAWSMGIPAVVRHANDRPLDGWLYDRALFGALPVLHVANSNATKKTLLDSAPWLEESSIAVIYNGIDARLIDSAVPAELNLPPGALLVGFAGRLETRKGLLDLVTAWPMIASAIPDAHLVIVGKGPDEAQARSITPKTPNIHWLGYRADVASVLHVLDIAIVPSHWEGFGLIAAEALIAGIPVVAANASSLPEIVTHDVTGVLIPPRDPQAIADAVIALARDPDRRMRMGAAGKVDASRRFSAGRMVDAYEEALQRTVKTLR